MFKRQHNKKEKVGAVSEQPTFINYYVNSELITDLHDESELLHFALSVVRISQNLFREGKVIHGHKII